MKTIRLLLVLSVLFNLAKAQCPPYVVNLTGQPEGTWMSPSLGRDYKCCGNNKAECIQFQVTLDPRTAGVQFEFYDGAPAYGSQDWQLNCDGVLHNVRDTICISGVGPHTITFCKPGNNEAVYYIRTIAKPTFPEDDTLRRGCYQQIMGYGLRNAVWNSIYPGDSGDYNNLLSCTDCVSPIAHAPNDTISYVDYYVCADPTATMCGYTLRTCDTVRVYFADSLKASVNPNPAYFCESAGGVTLNGNYTGGDGPYTFNWVNSSGISLANTQSYFANSQNTFTFEVKDRFYSATCPAAQLSVPVSIGQIPEVDAGSQIRVCSEGGQIVLNGSVTPAQGVLWTGGLGTFIPNRTVLSPTYIPTNDEINAGSLYLKLSSTGAGNGCTNTTDSVLITFSDTLKGTFSSPNLLCYNSKELLTFAVSGGVGPYTYKWNNGATGASTLAGEGNYCLFVKDAFGCEKEFCTTLNAPSAIDLQTSSIDVNANGASNGSAIVSALGGTSPYTYTWNTVPVQYNDTASGLPYGVYTVTVVDSNGCSRQVSVVVNEPRCLGLSATFTVKDVKCYGSNKGSATVYPQGGSAPYTYLWPDASNQNTPTASNLYAGTYQAIITDAIGCKEVVSVNITQPEPLNLSINHTDVTTVSGTNGSATAVVLGGTPPYIYNWSNGGGTSTISNLSAGNYGVTVYDFNKCSITDSVKITGPLCNTFNIYVTGTDVTCNDLNNGTASVLTINGVYPYTYLWSNGQTTSSINNLSPGTYSVNVVDSNGCVEFKNITIYQPNPLTASLSNTNVSCYGLLDGTVDLTVNGGTFPYSYSWSNGSQVEDVAYLGAGSYSVIIKDNRNCEITKSVTITQPSQLQLNFNSINNLCYGGFNGSIDLSVNGGQPPYTYSWNHGATTEDLTGLSAGAYVVTVRDGNSCQTNVSSPIVISEPDSIYITLVSKTDVDCNGNLTGSATVQAHGGSGSYSYLWNDAAAQTTATANGLATGIYTVRVLDNNGCTVPKYFTVTIGQPSAVLTVSASTSSVLCFGGNTGIAYSAASGGTMPYNYSWSNGVLNDTVTGLATGNYTIYVSDSKGCTASTSVTVSQPGAALATSFTSTNINCYNTSTGTAAVSVTGGTSPYSYLWSTSETINSISNKPSGNYSVLVTDANGCTINSQVTLTQPDTALYVKSSAQTNVLCFGGANGSASVTPFGGTAPYTYSWNTGSTNNSINGLSAGNYSVVVKDALNCTVSKSFTITQPAASLSLNITSTNVLCYGNATGSLAANVSGGTSPYTYSWSNGVSTSINSNLVAGTYNVLVTDKNGCTKSDSKIITQPSAPITYTFNKTNILCKGNSTGAATVVPAGGTAPYTYSWFSGETTASISNKPVGNYTVVIKDANLCSVTATVTLTEPSLSLSLSGTSQTNVLCFGNATGTASVTPFGGVAPYTYTWSNNTYNSSISNLTAGAYSVTVKDNNGCSVNQNFVITQPVAALSLNTSQTNVLCYGFNTGVATVIPSGGTSPYTYTWSNGRNTPSITNIIAGTYNVTVKDNNGCSANTSVTITQSNDINISAIVTPSSCGFPDNSGAIDLSVVGGSGAYTYTWSGPLAYSSNAQDISGLTSGNYNLILADGFGCTKTKNYTITAPGTLLLSSTVSGFVGGDHISCYNAADGTISVDLTGGTAPFTYEWVGPDGYTSNLEDIQDLEPGEYTLTVTDGNGCKNGLTEILTQPDSLMLSITPSVFSGNYNITCAGIADGTANLSIQGGNTNYSYSWSGPNGYTSSSQNITNLEAGTYSVIVNDANGCSNTAMVVLTAPDTIDFTSQINIYSGGYNISCAGNSDGNIEVQITGGDSTTYGLSWTYNGNPLTFTEPSISGLAAGVYNLTVTDDNGCTVSKTITLTEPDTLKAVASVFEYIGGVNVSCYNSKDGSINISTTGGDNTSYSFEWINNGQVISTNEDINGIGVGTYEFTVIDNNGCTVHFHEELSGPDSLMVSLNSSVYGGGFNLACNNSSDGSIGANVTGGTLGYQYSWTGNSFSSNLDSISSLGAGTYNLTVTDTNGCIAVASAVLTEPDTFAISISASQFSGGYNVSCAGIANGYLNSIITGGDSTSYLYSWTYNGLPTGYVGNNISGLAAGTYQLTVYDVNGCSANASFEINEPDTLKTPLISPEYIGGNQIKCFGESNAVITSQITGGDPATYSISWTYNGAYFASDSTSLHHLNAGTYILTVYDQNKCMSRDTVIITEPDAIESSSVISNYNGYGVSCNNYNDGFVDISVTGGISPYTYNWNNGETNQDVDTLTAGVYSVTVADANGCIGVFSNTITEPSSLNLIATANTYAGGHHISCNGLADGSISSVVSGGVPQYTYTWSGSAGVISNNAQLTGLAQGNYTIEVVDNNGCSKVQALTLTEPASMEDSISAQVYAGGVNVKCFGDNNGNINLNVQGGTTPYYYAWTGPGTFTSTTQFQNNVGAGWYYVAIKDENNCTINDSIYIAEPQVLQGTGVVSNYNGFGISCNGLSDGNIVSVINGGIAPYAYSWTNQAGTYTNSNDTLINVPADEYYLIVTDQNGCMKSIPFTLTEPEILAHSNAVSDFNGYSVSCYGSNNGFINTQVMGGVEGTYTYTWTTEAGLVSYNANVNNLFAETYYLEIKDANNCLINDTLILNEPIAISITDSVLTYIGGLNISCNGFNDGEIYTNVSGGVGSYQYSWTYNNMPFTQTASTITSLMAGNYSLVVTDDNGCNEAAIVTVAEPNALVINDSISNYNGYGVDCFSSNTGAIYLEVLGGTAGYNYQWNNGPANGSSQTQLIAGTYSVIVTDTNGCTLNKFISLSQPPALTSSYTQSNYNGYGVKCYNDTNGFATVTVNGGVTPYQINWNNNQTGTQLSDVGVGSYIYQITDLNGCVNKDTVEVNGPNSIALSTSTSAYNGYGVKCNGDTNATVDLSVTGGVSPYTYSWNNGSVSQDLTSVGLGNYNVTVVDLNQCASQISVSITEPQSISATTTLSNYNGFNLKCFNDGTGAVDLEVAGGVGGYSYSWSNNAVSQDLTGLQAGTYSVLITDLNDCKLFKSVELVQPDTVNLSLSPQTYAGGFNISCYGLSDGTINSTVSGGAGTYTYSWTGNGAVGSTSTISSLPVGTYLLFVSDQNNCSVSKDVTLSQPTAIVASSVSTNSFCTGATGSIDLSVEGGVLPYNYSWSNGAISQDLSSVVSGTYVVEIRDANNCLNTQSATVSSTSNLTVSGVVKDVNCFNAKDGAVTVVANGTAPYTYSWSNGASTSSITQLAGGAYTVIVTDANGCSNTFAYTVNENAQIVVDSVISVYHDVYNVSAYGANDGFIELTTTGGVSPYAYAWSNDASTSVINNLTAGIYVVEITDAMGCKLTKRYTLLQPFVLEMPSGYTPNNDGYNDAFVVHGIEAFPNNTITVFNRWGNIVYQKDSYNNEWRGINNSGDNLPDGTYFVILDINAGEKVLKGYVDLRRK